MTIYDLLSDIHSSKSKLLIKVNSDDIYGIWNLQDGQWINITFVNGNLLDYRTLNYKSPTGVTFNVMHSDVVEIIDKFKNYNNGMKLFQLMRSKYLKSDYNGLLNLIIKYGNLYFTYNYTEYRIVKFYTSDYLNKHFNQLIDIEMYEDKIGKIQILIKETEDHLKCLKDKLNELTGIKRKYYELNRKS